MADISETLEPKSDQQGFDDYIQGPRTVTVSAVRVDKSEQPVQVELAEYPGRPYKPNKSMRRVLAKGWGPDSEAWVGKSLTLFGNPDVIYAGKAVGGIEIAAMSGIDKPFTVPLTVTRGKKKSFKVDVLPDALPARDWSAEIAAADLDGLRALWSVAPDEHKPAITEKVEALKETGADA